MNYIKITKCDVANGVGVRTVLWVSGCSHKCHECHNPQTWDEKAGIPFDGDAKKELFESLEPSYISGITFSGGDPLYDSNVSTVLSLIKEIREKFPKKNIWLYTGFTVEEILKKADTDEIMAQRKEAMSLCDIVVDGPFILAKKDMMLKWKGSSNQRVIDVNQSLKQNKIVTAY